MADFEGGGGGAGNVGELWVSLGLDTTQFDQGMKQAERSAQQAATSIATRLKGIGEGVKAFANQWLAVPLGIAATIFSMQQLAQEFQRFYNMAKEGAKAMRIDQTFANVAESVGADAEKMADRMTAAVGRTVEDTKLKATAMRGMLYGLNQETIVGLAGAAKVFARTTGGEVGDVFNQLVNSSTMMIPRQLMRLRIITRTEMREIQKAISMGALGMEDIAQEAIRVSEVWSKKMKTNTYDVQSAFSRFGVAWDELVEKVGMALAVAFAPLLEILTPIMDIVTKLAMILLRALGPALTLIAQIIKMIADGIMVAVDAIKSVIDMALEGWELVGKVAKDVWEKLSKPIEGAFDITGTEDIKKANDAKLAANDQTRLIDKARQVQVDQLLLKEKLKLTKETNAVILQLETARNQAATKIAQSNMALQLDIYKTGETDRMKIVQQGWKDEERIIGMRMSLAVKEAELKEKLSLEELKLREQVERQREYFEINRMTSEMMKMKPGSEAQIAKQKEISELMAFRQKIWTITHDGEVKLIELTKTSAEERARIMAAEQKAELERRKFMETITAGAENLQQKQSLDLATQEARVSQSQLNIEKELADVENKRSLLKIDEVTAAERTLVLEQKKLEISKQSFDFYSKQLAEVVDATAASLKKAGDFAGFDKFSKQAGTLKKELEGVTDLEALDKVTKAFDQLFSAPGLEKFKGSWESVKEKLKGATSEIQKQNIAIDQQATAIERLKYDIALRAGAVAGQDYLDARLKQIKDEVKARRNAGLDEVGIQKYVTEETKRLYKDMYETMYKNAETYEEAMVGAWGAMVQDMKSLFQSVADLTIKIFDEIEKTLSDVILDGMKGKFKTLHDYMQGLKDAIDKMVADLIANWIMNMAKMKLAEGMGIEIPGKTKAGVMGPEIFGTPSGEQTWASKAWGWLTGQKEAVPKAGGMAVPPLSPDEFSRSALDSAGEVKNATESMSSATKEFSKSMQNISALTVDTMTVATLVAKNIQGVGGGAAEEAAGGGLEDSWWDKGIEKFKDGMDWVEEKATAAGNYMSKTLTDSWTQMGKVMSESWGTLTAALGEAWSAVKKDFGGLWDSLTEVFDDSWDSLSEVFTGSFNTMSSAFSTLTSSLSGVFSSAWSSLSNILSNAWNSLSSILSQIDFSGMMETGGNFFSDMFGGGEEGGGFSSWFDDIFSWFAFAKQGLAAEAGMKKFARGGLVHQPTLFQMKDGLGLMGEAGPEAVMPLRKTMSGQFAVKTASGQELPLTRLASGDLGVMDVKGYQFGGMFMGGAPTGGGAASPIVTGGGFSGGFSSTPMGGAMVRAPSEYTDWLIKTGKIPENTNRWWEKIIDSYDFPSAIEKGWDIQDVFTEWQTNDPGSYKWYQQWLKDPSVPVPVPKGKKARIVKGGHGLVSTDAIQKFQFGGMFTGSSENVRQNIMSSTPMSGTVIVRPESAYTDWLIAKGRIPKDTNRWAEKVIDSYDIPSARAKGWDVESLLTKWKQDYPEGYGWYQEWLKDPTIPVPVPKGKKARIVKGEHGIIIPFAKGGLLETEERIKELATPSKLLGWKNKQRLQKKATEPKKFQYGGVFTPSVGSFPLAKASTAATPLAGTMITLPEEGFLDWQYKHNLLDKKNYDFFKKISQNKIMNLFPDTERWRHFTSIENPELYKKYEQWRSGSLPESPAQRGESTIITGAEKKKAAARKKLRGMLHPKKYQFGGILGGMISGLMTQPGTAPSSLIGGTIGRMMGATVGSFPVSKAIPGGIASQGKETPSQKIIAGSKNKGLADLFKRGAIQTELRKAVEKKISTAGMDYPELASDNAMKGLMIMRPETEYLEYKHRKGKMSDEDWGTFQSLPRLMGEHGLDEFRQHMAASGSEDLKKAYGDYMKDWSGRDPEDYKWYMNWLMRGGRGNIPSSQYNPKTAREPVIVKGFAEMAAGAALPSISTDSFSPMIPINRPSGKETPMYPFMPTTPKTPSESRYPFIPMSPTASPEARYPFMRPLANPPPVGQTRPMTPINWPITALGASPQSQNAGREASGGNYAAPIVVVNNQNISALDTQSFYRAMMKNKKAVGDASLAAKFANHRFRRY